MQDFIEIEELNDLLVNIIQEITISDQQNKKYIKFTSPLFRYYNDKYFKEIQQLLEVSDQIKNNFKIKKIGKEDNYTILIFWRYNFFKNKKIKFNFKDNEFTLLVPVYDLPLVENNYLEQLYKKLTINEYYKRINWITPKEINTFFFERMKDLTILANKTDISKKRLKQILNYSLMNFLEENKLEKVIRWHGLKYLQ